MYNSPGSPLLISVYNVLTSQSFRLTVLGLAEKQALKE